MTEHVKVKTIRRTCQESGGSLVIIVPAEIVKELGLDSDCEVDVSLYYKYKRDEKGNMVCNGKGEPVVTKRWGTFWRAR